MPISKQRTPIVICIQFKVAIWEIVSTIANCRLPFSYGASCIQEKLIKTAGDAEIGFGK